MEMRLDMEIEDAKHGGITGMALLVAGLTVLAYGRERLSKTG